MGGLKTATWLGNFVKKNVLSPIHPQLLWFSCNYLVYSGNTFQSFFLYFNRVNWPLALVLVFHYHASLPPKSVQAILAVNSLKQLL